MTIGRIQRLLTLPAVGAAMLLPTACGGGAGRPPGDSSAGSTPTATAPPRLTHADPVSLLPTAHETSPLIRASASPSRYDQRLNSSTLSSAFSSAVPRSLRLASGTAELDVIGRPGTFLYAHVFEFRSLAGAESLTRTFLSATALGTDRGRPSGAPGQQGAASSQPYGHHREMSYRYAFRDQNVLAYVELDGPRGRFSLDDALRGAAIVDRHIQAALS
jgi:hypothetical protein